MGVLNKIYTGNKKILIQNTIAIGFHKGIDILVPLLVVPLLISRVGIEGYGKYAFSYAFVFYFLNITRYGFALSAVRDISQNRDDAKSINAIFNKVFSTVLCLTVVSIFFLGTLVITVPGMRQEYLLYLYFMMLIIGDSISVPWFFIGIENMKFISIINLVSKSSFLILVYLFVHAPEDYKSIALYQSIGFIAGGGISFLLIVYKFKIKIHIESCRVIMKEIKMGFSSFCTLFSPILYLNTSVFLTGIFGSPTQVSYIEIGTKITTGVNSLNAILSQVFFPFINRRQDKQAQLGGILIFSGLVVSLALFCFSGFIINIWLGSGHEEIIMTAKILSFSPLLLAITGAYGQNGLLVLRHDWAYLKIIFYSSILGLLLALILIPLYLHIGAAISIILPRIVMAVLSHNRFKRIKMSQNTI